MKTRIPGEDTYPEAIIGFHHALLAPLDRLITGMCVCTYVCMCICIYMLLLCVCTCV